VLIVVELGSVVMEDCKEINTRRLLGARLGNTRTLINVLFLVLENVRTVCARTCWIV